MMMLAIALNPLFLGVNFDRLCVILSMFSLIMILQVFAKQMPELYQTPES